tara:strand:- start:51 stop:338 length:288 start_codon:yes stop_codon:yes gene_type:complete
MNEYFSPGDFSKMNPDALIERQQELEKKAKTKLEAYVFKKLVEITLEKPKNNEAHKKQIEKCKEILGLLPPRPIDDEDLKELLRNSYAVHSMLNP